LLLPALKVFVIASSVPALAPTLMDETNAAVIARLDRATQGGFNRSSQHSSKGGCDEEIQAAFGSVCASGVAIARPDCRGPAGELQTVLDGDCLGAVERGCCG
jgi:hypothetical protein